MLDSANYTRSPGDRIGKAKRAFIVHGSLLLSLLEIAVIVFLYQTRFQTLPFTSFMAAMVKTALITGSISLCGLIWSARLVRHAKQHARLTQGSAIVAICIHGFLSMPAYIWLMAAASHYL
jgi:hypothetical protein